MPRYAPLDLILTTLETILLPNPIAAHLPSALKLIAHLQLLDRQLIHEARRVLDAHTRLVQRIKSESTDDSYGSEHAVNTGALSEEEIKLVRRIIKRGQRDEDVLFVASLELRHWHTVQLLNSAYPLEKIQPVIEAYFPSLPSESREQVEAKPRIAASLYIKSMTLEERRSWDERKRVVDRMVKLKQAGKSISASDGASTLDISQIVGIALRAAHVIQEDTLAMEAAFPSAAPKASRRATVGPNELKRDRPPKRARRSLPA